MSTSREVAARAGVLRDLDDTIGLTPQSAPSRPGSDGARQWAADVRFLRDSLDPVSATALLLIYEHHATPAQVALHLGLDESQLKSAVARALQRLAATLCPALEPSATRDVQ